MRVQIAIAVLALCLTSCTHRAYLSPEEVLHRSTLASRSLPSATYEATARFENFPGLFESVISGTIYAEGGLEDSGTQSSIVLEGEGTSIATDGQKRSWTLSMDALITGPQESYVRIESFEQVPPSFIAMAPETTALMGKWWQIGGAVGPRVPITPDPRVLRLQSDALVFLRDKGISHAEGHSSYHYDVTLDQNVLLSYLREASNGDISEDQTGGMFPALSAKGEVWIDVDTFQVRRIQWNISSQQESGLHILLDMIVKDFGVEVRIQPPEDAQPLQLPPAFSQLLPLLSLHTLYD